MQYVIPVILFDQLVLPMFHIGPIPFKPSYFLMLFMALRGSSAGASVPSGRAKRRSIIGNTVTCFACLIGLGVLGQATFCVWFPIGVRDGVEIVRSIGILVLMLLAVLAGLRYRGCNSEHMLYIFVADASVHFMLAFFGQNVPWLAALYRSEELEIVSASGDTRLGMWVNPNGAMLLHNMILVGLYLGYKWRRGTQYSIPVYLSVLATAAIICVQLGSRNQSVAFLVIVAVFLWELGKRSGARSSILLCGCLVILVGGVAWLFTSSSVKSEFEETRLYRRMGEHTTTLEEATQRPGIHLEEALRRFTKSPLWGSGFVGDRNYPFTHSPRSYHNDWLRIVVTGGILSLALMFVLVKRVCLRAGWIMALPLVLPGLTNTFMLHIPAIIAYFIYAGAFFPSKEK